MRDATASTRRIGSWRPGRPIPRDFARLRCAVYRTRRARRIRRRPCGTERPPPLPKGNQGNLMSTFGFYPGPINYWMLVTDWRGGSIAITLAIGALIVGYFACPR